VLTKEPLRLPYQGVEGKGPTKGFTSLIKDEVKTGGQPNLQAGLYTYGGVTTLVLVTEASHLLCNIS
jgi:hypothetical protein